MQTQGHPEKTQYIQMPTFNDGLHLQGKRPLGRPRRRWEDNIKMDLQEVGGGRGDWMELAQDRES